MREVYVPSPLPHRHIHVPASTRPRCPICKASVFSPAGIHPQCAAESEDARLRAEAKAAALALQAGQG